jgi:hypothetical protein
VNSKGFKCGIVRERRQLGFQFSRINIITKYTDAGVYTCNPGGRPHQIPGSYDHYDQDAKTYTDWGIECTLPQQARIEGLMFTSTNLFSIINFFTIIVDVKIDWCASKANGSTLDPKVQYAEFVSKFNFNTVFDITSDILFPVEGLQCYREASLLQLM